MCTPPQIYMHTYEKYKYTEAIIKDQNRKKSLNLSLAPHCQTEKSKYCEKGYSHMPVTLLKPDKANNT